MKKKFILGLVLGLVLSALFAPIAALADDGENFEKAGQQALQEREESLITMKNGIEFLVQEIAEDRVVTKDEMIVLWKEVRVFNQLKERYNEELVIYGKETSTTLDEGYKEAVQVYIDRSLLFKRDDGQGTVRAFFATKTGQDVVVEKGAAIYGAENIGFIAFTFLCLICMIFCIIRREKGPAIFFGIVFGLFLVLLLVC